MAYFITPQRRRCFTGDGKTLWCDNCYFQENGLTSFPCGRCSMPPEGSEDKLPTYYRLKREQKPTIKDSGERTVYPNGFQRDMHKGKGRMDLLPWNAIMEVSKHCENGAVKYGEHNVDLGCPVHSLMDSGMRHAAKFITGQLDEPHLTAACWNLLWALEMTLTHKDMVDIPWKPNADGNG